MEQVNKKLDDLKTIAAHKSADANQELVAAMRALVELKAALETAKTEFDAVKAEKDALAKENKDLKETLETRDYQILHLSRNLRALLDKQ